MCAPRVCVEGGGGDVDSLKHGVESHYRCKYLNSDLDLAGECEEPGHIVGDKYTGVRRQPETCG